MLKFVFNVRSVYIALCDSSASKRFTFDEFICPKLSLISLNQ